MSTQFKGFYTNIFYLTAHPASVFAVSYQRKMARSWLGKGIEKGNSTAPENQQLTSDLDNFWEWPSSDWEQFYINWVRYVQTVIPKERLLVFNVKEGVKPLEKFLGLDLPEGELFKVSLLNSFRLRDAICSRNRAICHST